METIERDRKKRAASESTWEGRTLAMAAMLFLSFVPSLCADQTDNHILAPIPHPMTMLLRNTDLRTELALRSEQIDAVEAALAEVELPLWRLRVLPASGATGRSMPS